MVAHKFFTILDVFFFFFKAIIEVEFLDNFKTLNGYWSYFGYNFSLIL